MILIYVLLFVGALAAGFTWSEQVLQASEQFTAQASIGHTEWYAEKVLRYAMPTEPDAETVPEDDPTADIARCAREIREDKVPSEQSSDAFKKCLEGD